MENNQNLWGEKWPAPAKINLTLRIVGQRADGYHLLQTVFQFINLCDWIQFHPAEDSQVSLINPLPDVLEADNLIIRAAHLLKAETDCKQGARIEIEKNLPMGGGLGGGSSDAATTLIALNSLWNLQLPTEKLLAMGLKLGADVPVFIFGHAAWAQGIGEKLEKIQLPERWVLIIHPGCHVNTKEIFSATDLTRNSKSITIADFMDGQDQNDCERLVSSRYPLVKESLADLAKFSNAKLTGTGACVFALFSSEQEAQSAYRELRPKWQVYLSKGVNISPLQTMLKTKNL